MSEKMKDDETMVDYEKVQEQNFPTISSDQPLPERREDDYEDDYLPGEKNFAQHKNPIGVAPSKQDAEAKYSNSGLAFG